MITKDTIVCWLRVNWYQQTWFGYTYIRMAEPGKPVTGRWHRNDSTFIKAINDWNVELESYRNDSN